MIINTILAVLTVVSSASALVPRGACNADNCLRALRATSPKTRLVQAQADCSDWLRVTTTPVVTATAFTTVTKLTSTILEAVTTTTTVYDTTTLIVLETPTETVYTSTETITVDPTTTVLAKRLAKPIIPAYASPCSGAVRYSSACSCIGVSKSVTVTAPTSTITVTASATGRTTVSATTIVATSITVIYNTTATVTVTEPAVTVSAVTTVTTTSQPLPTQLLINGDFETVGSLEPWTAVMSGGTLDVETTRSHSGAQSGRITINSRAVSGMYQPVSVEVDTEYTYTVWTQQSSLACPLVYAGCNAGPNDGRNNWFSVISARGDTLVDTWVQITLTCSWDRDRVGQAGVSVLLPNNCVPGGQVFFDDAVLVKR